MSRSLGLLTVLMISAGLSLSACKSFTLIGNVNLGGSENPAVGGGIDNHPADDASLPTACYSPLPDAAKTELRALGYIPANSPAFHAWLTSLSRLRSQLPPCPEGS